MSIPNPFRAPDLRIPVGHGHELRLVERPGRTLNDEARERLVADLRLVADRCVPGGTLRYGVLSGQRERLEQVVVAILYRKESGQPVGFNTMTWMDVTVRGRRRNMLHAGLCMIDPNARRGGFLGLLSTVPALLAFARNGLAPLWVSNVTQVPAVAGRFACAVGQVYPAPGRSRPPSAQHLEIAEQIMARHRHVFGVGADADFDADRFVIRNAYTGGSDDLKKSFEATGKHRDPRINDLCRDLLDYERGDDLLQLGTLSLGVVASLVGDLVRRLVRRVLPDLRRAPRPAGRRLPSRAAAPALAAAAPVRRAPTAPHRVGGVA